jgi:peptidoglycan hydrolase-like protein with peptidoglycan-binding domain
VCAIASGAFRPDSARAAQLLALQRAAGNRAVAGLLCREPTVQRCGATPCGCPQEAPPAASGPSLDLIVQRQAADIHELMSPHFAGDPVLEEVHRGALVLRPHAKGPHVTRIQEALLEFGMSLPKFGADGTYGSETVNAVKDFQRLAGLGGRFVDGLVGKVTMDLLDKRALPKAAPSAAGQETRQTPDKVKVEQTEPARIKKGEVQEPGKAEVVQDSQRKVQAPTKPEPAFQFPINVGITIPWTTIPRPKATDDRSLPFACENGVLQIGGKWNTNGVLIPGTGNKLSLLAEPELDFNFAPTFCGKLPAIQAQVELLKLKLNDVVELAIVGLLGSDTKPFGIARGLAVVLDVKVPLPGPTTKLELGGTGQWKYVPSADATTAQGIFGASFIIELP